VVVIGSALLLDGGGDPGRALDFKSGSSVPLAVLGGASVAFFALIGFEEAVNVAEETKEPSRVYPRALFLGLGIAGIVYMPVTVIASMAVETSKLVDSDGPLLEVVDQGPLGVSTKLFAAIALFALTNGALINLIMASRIVYGMSNEGIVPAAFGRVHEGRRTPWVAIAFTASLAVVLLTLGDLESLADTTVLLLLFVFVSVNVAVLVLRRDRVEHQHFHAPSVIPPLGAAACGALIVQKAFDEADTFLYAGGLIALGILLWLSNRVFTSPASCPG
jgi:APA family basic amino acid/polyamine antiporter